MRNVLSRFGRVLGVALPGVRSVVATAARELSPVYYALFAWWSKPEVPSGAEAYSVHRKSTDPLVLWLLLGLAVLEIAALHLILRHWSHAVAWALSDLGILGLLFILGTLRAMQLKPALVTATEISLSLGLMRSIHAPISSVSEITRHSSVVRKAREVLRTSLIEPPNVLVKFASPVRAETLYGGTRLVTSVAAFLDSPDAFIAAVESRRQVAHAGA
jgi:hypothetical protein